MKIYLDDERPCPPGWIPFRTVEDVIEQLKKGDVEEMSLDSDLGIGYTQGYKVMDWLEAEVCSGRLNRDLIPAKIGFHTSNPNSRKKMHAAMRNIHYYLNPVEESND